MHADLRMVPCESALCIIGCERISLGSCVRYSHCEGVCFSGVLVCPRHVARERHLDDMASSKPIDFYAIS
jgi:hypothetical protein